MLRCLHANTNTKSKYQAFDVWKWKWVVYFCFPTYWEFCEWKIRRTGLIDRPGLQITAGRRTRLSGVKISPSTVRCNVLSSSQLRPTLVKCMSLALLKISSLFIIFTRCGIYLESNGSLRIFNLEVLVLRYIRKGFRNYDLWEATQRGTWSRRIWVEIIRNVDQLKRTPTWMTDEEITCQLYRWRDTVTCQLDRSTLFCRRCIDLIDVRDRRCIDLFDVSDRRSSDVDLQEHQIACTEVFSFSFIFIPTQTE